MRANYPQMFGAAMTVLLIILVLGVPYKGESVLTRLARGAKVLK